MKPGAEAAFKAIEEDAARICADLKAPHPHLAIEALTASNGRGAGSPGVKEVWWLNAFESEAEKQRVYDAYAHNRPLMAALAGIGTRRQDVIAAEVDVFANYRADLSRGAPWTIAGARFFVVTVTTREHQRPRPERGAGGKPGAAGPPSESERGWGPASIENVAVFETSDGTHYIFKTVRDRDEADAVAAAAEPQIAIFAVRPYWGLPAPEWIDADPEFWRPYRV